MKIETGAGVGHKEVGGEYQNVYMVMVVTFFEEMIMFFDHFSLKKKLEEK